MNFLNRCFINLEDQTNDIRKSNERLLTASRRKLRSEELSIPCESYTCIQVTKGKMPLALSELKDSNLFWRIFHRIFFGSFSTGNSNCIKQLINQLVTLKSKNDDEMPFPVHLRLIYGILG